MNSGQGQAMMMTLMNSLRRLLKMSGEPPEKMAGQYSEEQLLIWAQGCMLEGLPDDFYQARLDCERTRRADGKTEISVQHQFRLTDTSAFRRFSPADDLYPVQCIEQVLKGKSWRKASLIFNPRKAYFNWE